MVKSKIETKRKFVATRSGRIHIATAGDGYPVLLLHQTPRSWDEFRDVLPLLGRTNFAIAMDTLGFGDSEALSTGSASIEAWADAAHQLLDTLSIERAAVVGHHTGAAIAIEMAASRPARVSALVLSASPYIDAEQRAGFEGKRVIDQVDRKFDGSHLIELWNGRKPRYPQGDISLLERFMIDALKAGERAAEGHRVVRRYVMETRLPRITCPTLILAPTADERAYPNCHRAAKAIRGSQIVDIDGGMLPLPDQMPELFAQTVSEFLARTLKTTD
jgi:pimeloyl-ACP methyl ester carboxylesterase